MSEDDVRDCRNPERFIDNTGCSTACEADDVDDAEILMKIDITDIQTIAPTNQQPTTHVRLRTQFVVCIVR